MKARISEKIEAAIGSFRRLDGPAQETIGEMAQLLVATFKAGGRVFICGNGGSAADAQHISGELLGHFIRERGPLAGIALTTDTSTMTAIGNDYSFEDVFARQLEALGRSGDVLWGLSTSGNSANVLAACGVARERGIKVIAMTGAGGGKLAGMADVCFRAPSDRTDQIQQLHQLAYHIICDLIDDELIDEG